MIPTYPLVVVVRPTPIRQAGTLQAIHPNAPPAAPAFPVSDVANQ